ncbi:MAG TPA: DUF4136 domain-containing protein [Burkholderiaceae bacterium]|nr:DUF4136 domain-containing protein [Burkholderiaceae bacterium]
MLIAMATLSGCAAGYLLDNQVQSFSQLTALPAPPTYRFERLPSQQAPGQAQLEVAADAALHKAGLRRDDANPRYSVQISGQMQRVLSPWAHPWDGWGWGGFGFGYHHRGVGIGLGGPFPRMESPWYQRDVAVIIRELASNRVVYETRASNAGPWMDSAAVFPALFEAAMQGFPTPPPGPRIVNIQVGR